MAGLPWVRVDSHIASHDKFLMLLADPSPKRWQAAFSYVCALGWAGSQGTDGHIPPTALPFVHGTTTTARLLVKYGLWEESLTGWQIRNYLERQVSAAADAATLEGKKRGLRKANCVRWHGDACGCWERAK